MNDDNNQNNQPGTDDAHDNDEANNEPEEMIEETEEFVPEDGEGNVGTTKDVVKDLREKLKKALAEKQEYLDGWQRTKADFVNARKRDEDERRELVKFANEDLLMQLAPVLDSFMMAFANKDAWEKVDKNWRTGVEYIYSQLKGVLAQNGFSEFDPAGEKFDPLRHQAIEMIPVSDPSKDHVVLEVTQKGYMLNGKVVRPASVKLGEFKEA